MKGFLLPTLNSEHMSDKLRDIHFYYFLRPILYEYLFASFHQGWPKTKWPINQKWYIVTSRFGLLVIWFLVTLNVMNKVSTIKVFSSVSALDTILLKFWMTDLFFKYVMALNYFIKRSLFEKVLNNWILKHSSTCPLLTPYSYTPPVDICEGNPFLK